MMNDVDNFTVYDRLFMWTILRFMTVCKTSPQFFDGDR